jgi:quercetin dioxygenase-like cupin family protein
MKISAMTEEVLLRKGRTLVRRLRLEPSERLPWHVDPYHRVGVVLHGERLEIEYRDSGERELISVRPGQVDWDEPTDRPHRATNVGGGSYEEVTIFFLDEDQSQHQPEA